MGQSNLFSIYICISRWQVIWGKIICRLLLTNNFIPININRACSVSEGFIPNHIRDFTRGRWPPPKHSSWNFLYEVDFKTSLERLMKLVSKNQTVRAVHYWPYWPDMQSRPQPSWPGQCQELDVQGQGQGQVLGFQGQVHEAKYMTSKAKVKHWPTVYKPLMVSK